MNNSPIPSSAALDALTGALFLLTALGVVATRQVLASLQLFILQSLLLSLSAFLLGIALELRASLCRGRHYDCHQNAADPLAASAHGQRGSIPHARGRTGSQHPNLAAAVRCP